MKIIVIEDDDDIRKLIEYALKNADFKVEGYEKAGDFFSAETDGDLFLLDIMLPDMDGIQILQRLKKSTKYRETPVIMLTAKNSEFDIVNALDKGADDYITKPFGVMELISRVKAMLRRAYKQEEKIVYKNLSIDENKRVVKKDGQEIYLTFKEFEIMLTMMKNIGLVMTRESLLENIWGYDFQGESRTVDMHIASLRNKIGEGYIQTVRGLGYKME